MHPLPGQRGAERETQDEQAKRPEESRAELPVEPAANKDADQRRRSGLRSMFVERQISPGNTKRH